MEEKKQVQDKNIHNLSQGDILRDDETLTYELVEARNYKFAKLGLGESMEPVYYYLDGGGSIDNRFGVAVQRWGTSISFSIDNDDDDENIRELNEHLTEFIRNKVPENTLVHPLVSERKQDPADVDHFYPAKLRLGVVSQRKRNAKLAKTLIVQGDHAITDPTYCSGMRWKRLIFAIVGVYFRGDNEVGFTKKLVSALLE